MIANNKISNAPTPANATLFSANGDLNPMPPAELLSVLARIDALRGRPENWNGYNTAAPNPESIEYATHWIQCLYNEICAAGGQWLAPHVSADEAGNASLEWQREEKNLTAYVSPDEVEYIRTPGSVEKIESGSMTSASTQMALWNWLTE